MKFPYEAILRAALIGTLYVLAAPVYLVLGTVRLSRILTAFSVISSGRVICVHCGHENLPLGTVGCGSGGEPESIRMTGARAALRELFELFFELPSAGAPDRKSETRV